MSAAPSADLNLRQLRLKPGMFLQLHPANDPARSTEAKFCAAIDGKGLMVVPLGSAANDWREGAALSIGGFTGQHDFRFDSRVLGNFSVPFAYVLLSYPQQIQARQVRAAQRIRTSLLALASGRDPNRTIPAKVIDLSEAGAMIDLSAALGGNGDPLTINFDLPAAGGSQRMTLTGTICHHGIGSAGPDTRVGMAFANPGRHDRLLLQNFALAAAAEGAVVD